LLAAAREAGPVDQLRLGAVLARVNRLTGIPIEDLHSRFRKKAPAKPAMRVHRDEEPSVEASPAPEVAEEKIPLARELAERQMLGILLKEPARWRKVSLVVHPEDFAGRVRRQLAELYWQHQQDLGEPVFNEFLGDLGDPAAKETAIELMEMAEQLAEVEQTLDGAIKFIEEERRRREEQKHFAELVRISQQNAGPEAEKQSFEAFLKNNPTSDPKRLGPVRRFKSGS
jgi:hypothetical protein